MNRFGIVAAAALAAGCAFAEANSQQPTTNCQLSTINYSWKVPNWTTIVTEPGAVRFAWVFTPNWTTPDKYDTRIHVYGVVQFVEVKDGQVLDFTMQGAGFNKYIER